MAGDPVPSSFFSALSSTFPLGEKFFIDSLRAYRDEAPAPLARDITDFVRQEALHTREHAAFNELVADLGYDTEPLSERTRAVLAPYYARGRLAMLGGTMALEHFTAILAHEILVRPRRVAAAPDHIAALWRWHATEEIEHKGVAFDTFLWVARGWAPPVRYAFRIRAMAGATVVLFRAVGLNMAELFRQDGLPPGRTWLRAFAYLFGPDGFVTHVTPRYLAWFLPGFHPWKHDDRALIADAGPAFAAWAA